MCDKKMITLNIRDFILKITKNSLKCGANSVMTKVITRDNGGGLTESDHGVIRGGGFTKAQNSVI